MVKYKKFKHFDDMLCSAKHSNQDYTNSLNTKKPICWCTISSIEAIVADHYFVY